VADQLGVGFEADVLGSGGRGMPTAAKPAASTSGGQSCFNSLSIILRRWEKARLTTPANVVRSGPLTTGASRRTRVTHAESTSGSGKNEPGEF